MSKKKPKKKVKTVECWNCGWYGGSSHCGMCDGFGRMIVEGDDE